MGPSSGLSAFALQYEISPIILVGGLAGDAPGGMIPIINLTQPNSFQGPFSQSAPDLAGSDIVAHFRPLPGGTLEEWQIGSYSFANQGVAANAVISSPLKLSMLMVAPAPTGGGYSLKSAAFSSLKSSLDQHINLGGYFSVMTPAFPYLNMILLTIRDVSPAGGDNEQVQTLWQWDFIQPLLTLESAQAAQNSLMKKWSAGVQITGNPPSQNGVSNSTGDPTSSAAPALVPSAQGTQGGSALQGAAGPVPGGVYGKTGS